MTSGGACTSTMIGLAPIPFSDMVQALTVALQEVGGVQEYTNALPQKVADQGVASPEEPAALRLAVTGPPNEGLAEGVALQHEQWHLGGQSAAEVGLAGSREAADHHHNRLGHRWWGPWKGFSQPFQVVHAF